MNEEYFSQGVPTPEKKNAGADGGHDYRKSFSRARTPGCHAPGARRGKGDLQPVRPRVPQSGGKVGAFSFRGMLSRRKALNATGPQKLNQRLAVPVVLRGHL